MNSEIELIHQFTRLASKSGFLIELFAHSPFKTKDVYSVREYHQFFPDFTNFSALAQHHGIPTRLLDWTENPIFAVYFACAPDYIDKSSTNICVWAFSKKRSKQVRVIPNNPATVTLEFKEQESYKNNFLRSQAGLFSVLKSTENYFDIHNEWPSVEAWSKQWYHKDQLHVMEKHVISSKQASEIIKILDKEGINQATLMPTLDNIAQLVMQRLG